MIESSEGGTTKLRARRENIITQGWDDEMELKRDNRSKRERDDEMKQKRDEKKSSRTGKHVVRFLTGGIACRHTYAHRGERGGERT